MGTVLAEGVYPVGGILGVVNRAPRLHDGVPFIHKDIERFFSLPIPRAVWEKVKDFQEEPFVRFVEKSIDGPNSSA